MKVLGALEKAVSYLERHGVESARLSAEHLLARILGCSRLDLYLRFDHELSEEAVARYREDLRRRSERFPLQYILGSVEFMGLPFGVREGVFIPRPETELLVEWIEELVPAEGALRFVEFGAGTGVIGAVLAARHPSWSGIAVDASSSAAVVANENYAALGVADRLVCEIADGLGGVSPALSFDLLVANPPYIPTAVIGTLEPEVSRYEDRGALDGGEDGLRCYPLLAEEGLRLLRPGGLVALEIGHGQGAAVSGILESSGYEGIALRKDYNRLERMVTARSRDGRGTERG